jgi:hypothetical protein
MMDSVIETGTILTDMKDKRPMLSIDPLMDIFDDTEALQSAVLSVLVSKSKPWPLQ